MAATKKNRAERALASLREALAATEPNVKREDVEALVVGFSRQQDELAKFRERARELDDEEVHQLILLASGALANPQTEAQWDDSSGEAAARAARATLDAIRRDVASRREK